MRELLRHPNEIALVVGLTMGGTLAFYTYTVYMQKFLVNSVGLTGISPRSSRVTSLFFYMLLQPVFGAALGQDRPQAGADGVRRAGHAVHGAAPDDADADAGCRSWRSCWSMAALVIVSGYTSINAVVKAELFPANIRALGVGCPMR